MTFRSDSPSRRSRLLNVAATAWLLFISAAVVINHVSLPISMRFAGPWKSSFPQWSRRYPNSLPYLTWLRWRAA